ncbi:hypothetical protein P886_4106 [Alteromonadaceae bacterium 2753L.S.0a.02]|nr:hypothetical protein P886_4106 [Alteromonadaceae bacterium 2753L.S.0a.02]
MTAVVENGERLLLFDMRQEKVYAIVGQALSLSQSTKACLRDTIGSLLLSETGKAYKIIHIERVCYFGDGLLKKIVSFLAGAYSIKVEMEEIDINFEAIRRMVVQYFEKDVDSSNPTFYYLSERKAEIVSELSSASSIQDLLAVLEVPPIEDCMDSI